MQILLIILFSILGLVALVLVLALFLKKEYAVERSIAIRKPKAVVFDYIKHLKNQDNFSKWGKMDPNMKKEFTGVDGTVGFVSSWNSTDKNVGVGEQEIKKIVPNERIDYQLRFIKPFKSVSDAYMMTEQASEGETTVKWGFAGKMNY
ncbi:MAG: SRPBCC family protein, partial [Bacteroidia bacterium]